MKKSQTFFLTDQDRSREKSIDDKPHMSIGEAIDGDKVYVRKDDTHFVSGVSSGVPGRITIDSLEGIEKLPAHVTRLYLGGNRISTVEGVEFPDQITHIGLNSNNISSLKGAKLPKSLEHLSLAGNPITALEGVEWPETLKKLSMNSSSLREVAWHQLPKNLEEVMMREAQLTSLEGIEHLPQSVTSLNLLENSINEEGAARLIKLSQTRPNLQIHGIEHIIEQAMERAAGTMDAQVQLTTGASRGIPHVKKHPANLYYYLKTVLSNGKHAWFVVRAFDHIKLSLLEGAIKKSQPYNIRDYAEILYAGSADQAPATILAIINKKYGTHFSA